MLKDVLASLNAGELALRRFREIARIAGLVFAGYPGAPKSTRQVQASSGLFFEVFKQYDAGNLLLAQAGKKSCARNWIFIAWNRPWRGSIACDWTCILSNALRPSGFRCWWSGCAKA